uniref:Uncharacterized protein n=1 Tax=Leersia perrieri TaxID=77586 RepID=A0A0D9XF00_9ORYZ
MAWSPTGSTAPTACRTREPDTTPHTHAAAEAEVARVWSLGRFRDQNLPCGKEILSCLTECGSICTSTAARNTDIHYSGVALVSHRRLLGDDGELGAGCSTE